MKLNFFDSDLFSKGEFLGCIEISFFSLIKLYDGEYIFSLKEELNHVNVKYSYIKGYARLKIRFNFPYWDNFTTQIPVSFNRKIKIVSGLELAEIASQDLGLLLFFFIGYLLCYTILLNITYIV